jgi:adenosylcobinamide-GDP ribazoletransferase
MQDHPDHPGMMRTFRIALQFLTVIPVRLQPAPQAHEQGHALLWYPVIGLMLGLMLLALGHLLPRSEPALDAALLLAVWVGFTGALHLDGLADTADAWVGGHGDRQRTLAIMKDPRAGPMAVVAISLVLLLKYAALQTLLAADRWEALLLSPTLGRAAMPLLLASTPYLRADGIATDAAASLPRRSAYLAAAMLAVAIATCFRSTGIIAMISAAMVFVPLRALLLRRLGGVTGDTCGAMLEWVETVTALSVGLGASYGATP